ncbi:MAG: glutathione S-transferase family protein [Xanthobacteraceae bacterium]
MERFHLAPSRAIGINDVEIILADRALHGSAERRQSDTKAIMTFTFYNAPQSTCSQRARFVLNAKSIPFAEIKLDLLAGDQLKPNYLALNPNVVVPTRSDSQCHHHRICSP